MGYPVIHGFNLLFTELLKSLTESVSNVESLIKSMLLEAAEVEETVKQVLFWLQNSGTLKIGALPVAIFSHLPKVKVLPKL